MNPFDSPDNALDPDDSPTGSLSRDDGPVEDLGEHSPPGHESEEVDAETEAWMAARDTEDAQALAIAQADPGSWWNRPPTGRAWWRQVAQEINAMGVDLGHPERLADLALLYLVEFYGQDSAFCIDISNDDDPITTPGWWPVWSGRRAWDPRHVAARAFDWAVRQDAEHTNPDDAHGERPSDSPGGYSPATGSFAGPIDEAIPGGLPPGVIDFFAYIAMGDLDDALDHQGLVEVTLPNEPGDTSRWTDTYGPYPTVIAAKEVAAALNADPTRFGYDLGATARAVTLFKPGDLTRR